MSEHKAKTVTMTSLKYHTLHGKEHKEGATYEVEADQVENLVAQGMARPSDEIAKDEKDHHKAADHTGKKK